MKRSNFTEPQIAFILRQAEEGTAVGEVCRKAGLRKIPTGWSKDGEQFTEGQTPIRPGSIQGGNVMSSRRMRYCNGPTGRRSAQNKCAKNS
jgi:hypothetical protein